MFWKRTPKEEPTANDATQPVEAPAPAEPGVSTPEQPEPANATEEEVPRKKGIFARLWDSLGATRDTIVTQTINLFKLRGKIDEDLLEELEEVLIAADVGLDTSVELIQELRTRIRKEKKADSTDLKWLTRTLQSIAMDMLDQGDRSLNVADTAPSIYLVIGVNGVGKTTAIGKLSHRLKNEGKSVLVVAADTFRAAAIQQLEVWAQRADVPIEKGEERADPSSVVFRSMQRARNDKPDAVIIDTAGRLHTKSNLMQELSKMSRIISREFPGAPHETMLVLDASTGQNALQQAKVFLEACPITGLILTKLDGTAKGGVVIALHKALGLPVKFIGVGEGINDLEVFSADAFTRALFQMEIEGDEEPETHDSETTTDFPSR